MNSVITTLIRWLSGISASQWQAALKVVLELADEVASSKEKRERAAGELAGTKLSPSKVNFLIELAVQYAKKKGWL